MRQVAIRAVMVLVSECAPVANNPTIDRIERRFHCVGVHDYFERKRAAERAAWIKERYERMTTWEDRMRAKH